MIRLPGVNTWKDDRRHSFSRAFGFRLSCVKDSHHIFVQPEDAQLINIQEGNGQAKAFQIWQFLKSVERYDLGKPGKDNPFGHGLVNPANAVD